jgi:hypothetical protein
VNIRKMKSLRCVAFALITYCSLHVAGHRHLVHTTLMRLTDGIKAFVLIVQRTPKQSSATQLYEDIPTVVRRAPSTETEYAPFDASTVEKSKAHESQSTTSQVHCSILYKPTTLNHHEGTSI